MIEREADRFDHQVSASMLELYRNDLIDLLDDSVKKVSIRTDLEGAVQIENATEVDCRDANDLSDVLDRGLMFRRTAATAMNSESSRSHLLLTVTIVSVNRETGQDLCGKIQLIDLAGSERLKKSLATGERQKEAIDINKSLTALGDVIEALTQGHKAVPYRNHKLTQVLQDSLGNTAKTLMFVNCSPARSNAEETLASLRYATRAKRVPGPPTPRGVADGTPRGSTSSATPRHAVGGNWTPRGSSSSTAAGLRGSTPTRAAAAAAPPSTLARASSATRISGAGPRLSGVSGRSTAPTAARSIGTPPRSRSSAASAGLAASAPAPPGSGQAAAALPSAQR